MKLIIAFIRPEALQDVKTKLYAQELYSLSVTNVLGAGQQKGYTEAYRGIQTEVNLLKKIRLEIGVAEEKVEQAIKAITEGAHSGQAGDGVIFVLDVARTLRIRTGDPI
ncbi:MAG: P-II family nitrogen regulator [Deltaproteobacteria bacterium]|jgi:nitrogen regulatory protein P-II 1|nr:P-II family nitrogen regulator [Deltaproteobacteria bacterium]